MGSIGWKEACLEVLPIQNTGRDVYTPKTRSKPLLLLPCKYSSPRTYIPRKDLSTLRLRLYDFLSASEATRDTFTCNIFRHRCLKHLRRVELIWSQKVLADVFFWHGCRPKADWELLQGLNLHRYECDRDGVHTSQQDLQLLNQSSSKPMIRTLWLHELTMPISSLSLCFFPLAQAGASVKKRESDLWQNPGVYSKKLAAAYR